MTVVTLTKSTTPAFSKDKQVQGQGYIVLFHMATCPHCIIMRPNWEKVKKDVGKKCNIAEIEYSDISALPKSMQTVRGFPTIMAYKNATPVAEYAGDRSAKSIADFAKIHASAKSPAASAKSAKPVVKPATKKGT